MNRHATMEQTGNTLHRQTGCRFVEPPLYDVVMHNDDVTTMDFVVGILKSIFRKGEAEAEAIMLKVHHEGSAVCGTYYKDIARSKADLATETARANGFPLKLSIQKTT